MKRLLLNSSLLKTNIQNAFIRGIASESVVQSFQAADRNSTLGQRWQHHENQILIAGVETQELELEKAGKAITELTRREKWEEIENYCHFNGINRSAEQCRQRWQRLLHAFSKIKHWESCRPPDKSSFWSMKTSEKKAEGLLFSLDLETFNAIDIIQSRKGVTCIATDFSDTEAVSPESPSSEVNVRQQVKEDSETRVGVQETSNSITGDQEGHVLNQASSAALRKSIQVLPAGGLETGISITDDQEGHALDQASSTASMNCIQETNFMDDDDRPVLFVNAINDCLSYLKDLVPDSGEPFKAQADGRSRAEKTHDKVVESPKKPPSGE